MLKRRPMISSTDELCDELCESSERWVLGCSCCAGANGQNASRRDCCWNERLENKRAILLRIAVLSHCSRSLEARQQPKELKELKQLSTPPGAPAPHCEGACAVLIRCVVSDLDDRCTSRLRGRFCVALAHAAIGVASCAINSCRDLSPALLAVSTRSGIDGAPRSPGELGEEPDSTMSAETETGSDGATTPTTNGAPRRRAPPPPTARPTATTSTGVVPRSRRP